MIVSTSQQRRMVYRSRKPSYRFADLMGIVSDDAGQATIEWALVLAFIALPMYFIFKVCLNLLVAHYQMVTFLETLPFP